jgi:hypothetical protein
VIASPPTSWTPNLDVGIQVLGPEFGGYSSSMYFSSLSVGFAVGKKDYARMHYSVPGFYLMLNVCLGWKMDFDF